MTEKKLDIQLDGTDFRIIAELVENGRESFVEIGKRLTLHPNVVAYRVNRMVALGVIRGYSVQISMPTVTIHGLQTE